MKISSYIFVEFYMAFHLFLFLKSLLKGIPVERHLEIGRMGFHKVNVFHLKEALKKKIYRDLIIRLFILEFEFNVSAHPLF